MPQAEESGGTRQLTARPDKAGSVESCLQTIERVEQVVDQETLALKTNQPIDLVEINRRKSHGLLDLTRGLRALNGGPGLQAVEGRLATLRARLNENSAVLRRHLDAVQEVSAIVARAIREGESDGTYSAAVRFPGGTR